MTDALRRSFAVTFLDPTDPVAADCLARLDELAATLARLSDVGLCNFQATSQTVVRGGIVGHATVFRFFKLNSGGDPVRTAQRVMAAFFDLLYEAPETRVRFFCREYRHPQGVCECQDLVWSSTGASIVYESMHMKAARWVMSRADLLALTDAQLETLPCHPNTRKNIISFINWLRANPNAD